MYILIAGQHRCAAIPRYVDSVDVSEWQGVLGTSLEINFWLRMEKNVSNYISGVSETFVFINIGIRNNLISLNCCFLPGHSELGYQEALHFVCGSSKFVFERHFNGLVP
jgi:hypothetical protein